MFALEINFQDGISQSETVYVRRPLALIGGQDSAHVVIDDMNRLDYQLRLVRDVGRTFRCSKVYNDPTRDPDVETLYEGSASLHLGPVKLNFVALDTDLTVRDTEPPDRAGVRILRHASAVRAPRFPAVLVLGNPQTVVSFEKGQPLYIGRSKQCLLRLDAPDISAQHARVGFENGEFWIEDLGSTNGTFVNQQQISGRVAVPPIVPIVMGRDTSIMGVTSEQQLRGIERSALGVVRPRPQSNKKYPVLISVSEVARPARLVIPLTGVVQLGRDPTSDMWLGAPHVSRMHCTVSLSEDGALTLTDQSTNGTAYDGGMLHKGDAISFNELPTVLDFGGGVTVALCFNEAQEQSFIASQGALSTFSKSSQQMATDSGMLRTGAPITRQALESQFGDSLEMPEEHATSGSQGFVQILLEAYRSAGRQGKLVMILAVVAVVLIIVVSATLLRPLFG